MSTTWPDTLKTAVVLLGCALVGWGVYDTLGFFAGRIITGLALGAVALWLGNGMAIPAPFRFLELPLMIPAALLACYLLIDPPEKTVSIRKVLLKGHPDPDHPMNRLPGTQETVSHILGYILAVLCSFLLTYRLVYGLSLESKSTKVD
eukprot:Sspe_Gene.100419::Locus_75117_Transcript_1_1_Confidence_1.000_Length_575::g.100419::m.100419